MFLEDGIFRVQVVIQDLRQRATKELVLKGVEVMLADQVDDTSMKLAITEAHTTFIMTG